MSLSWAEGHILGCEPFQRPLFPEPVLVRNGGIAEVFFEVGLHLYW